MATECGGMHEPICEDKTLQDPTAIVSLNYNLSHARIREMIEFFFQEKEEKEKENERFQKEIATLKKQTEHATNQNESNRNTIQTQFEDQRKEIVALEHHIQQLRIQKVRFLWLQFSSLKAFDSLF